FVLLGNQLDRHEQFGEGGQFGLALLAAAVVLLEGLANLFELLGHGAEALAGDFRIRAAVAFFFLFLLGFFSFAVVVLGVLAVFVDNWSGRLRRRGDAVVRVDIATQDL